MNTLPRRAFLKTAALSALAGPNIVRATAPKQKVRVACVGVGGMGSAAVQAANDEEIVAFCDVDWRERESEHCAFKIAAKHPEVPRPVIENTSSIGMRNGLSISLLGAGMNVSAAVISSNIGFVASA